jgi:uncharacterized protein
MVYRLAMKSATLARGALVLALAGCAARAPEGPPPLAPPVPETPMAKQPSETDLPLDLLDRSSVLVRALAERDFERVVRALDPKAGALLDATKLELAWRTATASLGAFRSELERRSARELGHESVTVTCELERGRIDVKLVYDAERRVAGLWLLPAWSPPAYADPSRFVETELTVGEGTWALPGTLTRPSGDGPFPAVVLVHGSGPHDRDESIGPNKPFKDLAWGLATRGVAVVRYEKRTKVHLHTIRDSKQRFTVNEETVDDALSALALLRRSERIDPAHVLVLGHSMGGSMLPRIGARDPKLAGLIALAAAATATEDAIVAQFRYVFELDGALDDEEKKKLAALEEQAKKVRALGAGDLEAPAIFGAPPSYWLDLQGYDPAREAKKLRAPVLFLQGGRDYQVTRADFERFRRALVGKKNVRFELYDSLNHLFFAGTGRITPAEYERAGNVDERVIEDITRFVESVKPRG